MMVTIDTVNVEINMPFEFWELSAQIQNLIPKGSISFEFYSNGSFEAKAYQNFKFWDVEGETPVEAMRNLLIEISENIEEIA